MTILILGARGYLGEQFRQLYPEAKTPSVDVADRAALIEVLDDCRPDVVINAAGKTGRPNVDWCEDHREETIRSNVTGPLILLEECAKRGVYWVHLSSGCIYEGENGGAGFSEDDAPNFQGSFYARSKIWSEAVLREFPLLILRLRMPFDGTWHDRNLIMKLRNYARVLDVPNSLTSIPDFLRAAQTLIAERRTGTFNVVNPGAISPYEVMDLYRRIVDPGHAFERLTLEQLPSVVRAGRSNCILSSEKLRSCGIVLPSVHDAMQRAMAALAATREIGVSR